jgi:hypothetical protein
MWKYEQSTGQLFNPEGELVARGYSGHDAGLNNPAMQDAHDIGPIPIGEYAIDAFFDDLVGGKGPIVAHLDPKEGTDTFGRSGFMIHGDNSAANHSASHGCVILSRLVRVAIRDSFDRVLQVVS